MKDLDLFKTYPVGDFGCSCSTYNSNDEHPCDMHLNVGWK